MECVRMALFEEEKVDIATVKVRGLAIARSEKSNASQKKSSFGTLACSLSQILVNCS